MRNVIICKLVVNKHENIYFCVCWNGVSDWLKIVSVIQQLTVIGVRGD